MKVFPKKSLCISHRRILCLAGLGIRHEAEGRRWIRWKDQDEVERWRSIVAIGYMFLTECSSL